MANRRRDLVKERWWRDALKRQAASGLSVREFCGREKLVESAFYAWRRTLAERDGEATSTQPSLAFVPLSVIDQPSRETAIEITLAGGRKLRLPPAITAEWLAELVHALEERAAR